MKYLLILALAAGCVPQTGGIGLTGPKGAPGDTIVGPIGDRGPAGIPGLNGADGTQITLVQLCSGFVPSYPSTFPEVAECVNGSLYGVYSANGGFLVYLPPGSYSSNGINASCTFNVLPNCQVSH